MNISVVIPVYNVKSYLERCVNSVLCQTYKNLEIILVDDGSTDGSGELCDQITTKDQRIRVIHQRNQGVSAARNTGIREAVGEYIIFMDPDDFWLIDDGLETVMRQCEETTELICFNVVDIWKDGCQSLSPDYNLEIISRQPNTQALFSYIIKSQALRLTAWIVVVRRQILIDNKIFFPSRIIGEDFFWHMLLWQHIRNVKMVNVNLYGYWHRQDNITSAPVAIWSYQEYDKIFTYWKEQHQQGCVNGNVILGHMANIWMNRGYVFCKLSDSDKPKALDILRKHADLLEYAIATKAKRTAKLYHLLGLKATIGLLSLYCRLRKQIKVNTNSYSQQLVKK